MFDFWNFSIFSTFRLFEQKSPGMWTFRLFDFPRAKIVIFTVWPLPARRAHSGNWPIPKLNPLDQPINHFLPLPPRWCLYLFRHQCSSSCHQFFFPETLTWHEPSHMRVTRTIPNLGWFFTIMFYSIFLTKNKEVINQVIFIPSSPSQIFQTYKNIQSIPQLTTLHKIATPQTKSMLSESGTSPAICWPKPEISHHQCLQCFPSPPSNPSWASWAVPALPYAAAAPPRCGAALAWTGCHACHACHGHGYGSKSPKVQAPDLDHLLVIFQTFLDFPSSPNQNINRKGCRFFFQFGALFLVICYILEQKPVLCWILEQNCDCWSTTVLGLNSGIGCYHSVGWFRVGLGFI